MRRRFLLDTGPAFDFLFQRRGVHHRVEAAVRNGAKIGICVPVLGEIIAGLEGSTSGERSWLIAQKRLRKIICWPYDTAAAHEYGRIFSVLRRAGRPMQQIDIMIAAVAFTLGNCTVVTMDSDFAAIPGLSIENWAATA